MLARSENYLVCMTPRSIKFNKCRFGWRIGVNQISENLVTDKYISLPQCHAKLREQPKATLMPPIDPYPPRIKCRYAIIAVINHEEFFQAQCIISL